MFLCVLPKKGVIIPGRAFHKLLGNFLATSGIWSNFLILFRTTFCFLSNFSRSLVILRYRNSLYCLNSSFLKRSQILLPGADHGWKMHAAGLLGQRFLKENWKWRTKPVSGDEGHSTSLLVHTRIFTRLILILTGAHDYEAMGSWYWCVVFTQKFFGFYWGQSYLVTPQNCTIMLRNSLFCFIQFAYSGTRLIRTPRGHAIVSVLSGCPY